MACFTLRGRDFENFQTGFGDGRHRRAARLAHDDGRLQILREEKSFDDADGRLMFVSRPRAGFPTILARQRERSQFCGQEIVPCAEREGMRFGQADDAVAGAAQ